MKKQMNNTTTTQINTDDSPTTSLYHENEYYNDNVNDDVLLDNSNNNSNSHNTNKNPSNNNIAITDHTNSIESHTVLPDQRTLFRKMIDSMNPITCLQPSSVSYETTTTTTSKSSSKKSTSSSSCQLLPDILLQNQQQQESSLDDIVPPLLEILNPLQISHQSRSTTTIIKQRSNAIRELYQLTDRHHKQNRVPIVCTTKYDIIGTIAKYCLLVDENDECSTTNDNNNVKKKNNLSTSTNISPNDRRQSLLLINNLCIPTENKYYILYECVSYELLMSSLLRIIYYKIPDSYIAIVILVNLSSINSTSTSTRSTTKNNKNNQQQYPIQHMKQKIFSYVPTKRPDYIITTTTDSNSISNSNYKNNKNTSKSKSKSKSVTPREAPTTYQFHIPTSDEYSLLRIIEHCLQDYTPYITYQCNNNSTNNSNNTSFNNIVCGTTSTTNKHTISSTVPVPVQQVVLSVEQEFIRWSLNLFRSLLINNNTTTIATIIANQTIIVQLAGYCLYISIKKQYQAQYQYQYQQQEQHAQQYEEKQHQHLCTSTWTKDSIEDASIMILVYCGQYNECIGSIRRIQKLDWTLQQLIQLQNNYNVNTTNNSSSTSTSIFQTRAKILYDRLFVDTISISNTISTCISTTTTSIDNNHDNDDDDDTRDSSTKHLISTLASF